VAIIQLQCFVEFISMWHQDYSLLSTRRWYSHSRSGTLHHAVTAVWNLLPKTVLESKLRLTHLICLTVSFTATAWSYGFMAG